MYIKCDYLVYVYFTLLYFCFIIIDVIKSIQLANLVLQQQYGRAADAMFYKH